MPEPGTKAVESRSLGTRGDPVEREIPFDSPSILSGSLRAGSSLRLKDGCAQDDINVLAPNGTTTGDSRSLSVIVVERSRAAPSSPDRERPA